MSPSLAFAVRLALLGAGAVLVQIVFVSQLTVFGVPPDLGPLVVMTVGLFSGSVTGAAMGFAMGLFVDTALLQTLGTESLLYIVVGYGAGRLRELRDPDGPLVPMAGGALATLTVAVGLALIEFSLGVNAPVSWLLLRQIIVGVIVNTLLALPVYAAVRRILGATLPDEARRRRRIYAAGSLGPLTRSRL